MTTLELARFALYADLGVAFGVPAKTRDAASSRSGLARAWARSGTERLSTGMLSPVTGAWLTALVP